MIPMIDLLMVTISFLLITAVWTHMARINADAQVPGPPRPDVEQEKMEPEKQLHVEMQGDDKFVLVWKQGSTTVDSIDVPRKDVVDPRRARRRSSASRTWRRRSRASGRPRASTRTRRTGSSIRPSCTPTTRPSSSYIIGVIDAIYQTHRDMQPRRQDREGAGVQHHLRGQLSRVEPVTMPIPSSPAAA